jgi:hypothetical protein
MESVHVIVLKCIVKSNSVWLLHYRISSHLIVPLYEMYLSVGTMKQICVYSFVC